MENFFSRLLMETEASSGQRRSTKEMSSARDKISSNNEDIQLAGLIELCDMLNMSNSSTVGSIRPNVFIPLILSCLQKEHNIDLMLLAARALTYMVDAITSAVYVLTTDGGIDILLRHLREVKDVELSEQCVTCVEKITQYSCGASTTLQNGGVRALLGFVDFFSASSQRKAWTGAAAMCRRVDASNFHLVEASLPEIRARVDNDDGVISEKAIACLHRIISGVRTKPALVAQTFGDVSPALLSILTRGEVAESTFAVTLALIGVAVSSSTEVTRTAIEGGIVECFLALITRHDGAMEGTRERSVSGSAPADTAARDRRLGLEQTKTVCIALAGFLPKITEDYLAHGHILTELVHERSSGNLMRDFAYHDDDEEEDEDEDEDLLENLTYEEIRERLEEEGVPLETNPRYSRCNVGSHSCDTCGKECLPGDWFRCNKCSDFDLCGQCVLMCWEEHVENDPLHTFCDMMELFSGDQQTSGGNAVSTDVTPSGNGRSVNNVEDILNTERQKMYHDNPLLLAIILKGLPRIVALFNESETHIVRNHSMAFIDRAVCLASAEQLIGSGFVEAAVCEMITAAVTDSNLILNVQAVFLCRKLLEKLPNVYMSSFVREGVTNALVKVQQQNHSSTTRRANERSADKKAAPERLHTIADWRDLVASEAQTMLSRFPSINDPTRAERLMVVVSLMKKGKLQESFEALRDALLDETTAFELSSSNVLHELRETLVRVNDVQVVVALVKTLARESASENVPSALTRFVRHLQTVLSHLDQFRPPSFGEVNSIHMQIPIRIIPHIAETQKSKSSNAAKSGAGSGVGKRSTAPNQREAPKRVNRVLTVRLGAPTSGTLNVVAPTSLSTTSTVTNNTTTATTSTPATAATTNLSATATTGGASVTLSGGSARGTHERREVTVSVEPLTNMESIMSFVSNTVLSGSSDVSRRRLKEDDEGNVEDILPELADRNPLATMTSVESSHPFAHAPTLPSPTPVYLRYESHVLPPSMTVLQMIQQYNAVNNSRSKNSSRPGRKNERILGATTQQLIALLEETTMRSNEPIKVYYSTVPFGPGYSTDSMHQTGLHNDPDEDMAVRPPSDGMQSPAVLAVFRALRINYPFSNRFLTVAQKDVLTLLGTLYEALLNWSDLLPGDQTVRSPQEKLDESEFFSPSTSLGEFINHKLNNKAIRHSSNLLLAGQHLNTWAVNLALDCNFLFTTTTRKLLFQISFCGTLRSLVQMQDSMEKYGIRETHNLDHQLIRPYRLVRDKKRVWRNHTLECAMEIMGKQRTSGSTVMEFEYYGENGSGLGPTMEFYTLVSKELYETKLRLWRRGDETPDEMYYRPQNGVYPRPLSPNSSEVKQMETYFLMIGRFLARALLDKRILPLTLSPVLLKMLRGDECSVYDLISISEPLGNTVVALSRAAQNGSSVVQLPGTKPCAVEDLGLDFTLPGDELIELKPGGANISLTPKLLAEYCDAVTMFMLRTGVQTVVKALRRGFHDYIPLHALQMLNVDELHELLCGHAARVTMEDLENHCHADHGYSMNCRHVRELFEIIASFNEDEQRRFFLFLTGSAHLPVGGLASLRPKFTIVRKTATDSRVREQDQLPSAMTCQNYLKLPAYNSKEQMEHKLRQAIDEGCGAFLLT